MDALPQMSPLHDSEREASLGWLKRERLQRELECRFDEAPDKAKAGASGEAAMYLQFSSGTTSAPKAVVLQSRQVDHHLSVTLGPATWYSEQRRVVVSWLPYFHDMGLVGGILMPLFAGGTAHHMSPEDFVRRPLLWLEILTRVRASHALCPNFALSMCMIKYKVRLPIPNYPYRGKLKRKLPLTHSLL